MTSLVSCENRKDTERLIRFKRVIRSRAADTQYYKCRLLDDWTWQTVAYLEMELETDRYAYCIEPKTINKIFTYWTEI